MTSDHGKMSTTRPPDTSVEPIPVGHEDGAAFKEDLFVPTAEGKSARLIGLTTMSEIREAKRSLFDRAFSYYSRAGASKDEARH
jgi:hypothetical protein